LIAAPSASDFIPYMLKPRPIVRGASSAPRTGKCGCKNVQLAIAAAARKNFLRAPQCFSIVIGVAPSASRDVQCSSQFTAPR
jgi:hypothetical protein